MRLGYTALCVSFDCVEPLPPLSLRFLDVNSSEIVGGGYTVASVDGAARERWKGESDDNVDSMV